MLKPKIGLDIILRFHLITALQGGSNINSRKVTFIAESITSGSADGIVSYLK